MSFKRVRIVILAGCAVLVAVAALSVLVLDANGSKPYGQQLSGAHRSITIGTSTVRVVTVDDEASRRQGLSGTTGLARDEGMLFVYEREGRYGFWMKDMRYRIDILWLSSSGTVVGWWKDAAPESYPRVYAPETPARYVLELPAGFANAHGIKIGDTVGF